MAVASEDASEYRQALERRGVEVTEAPAEVVLADPDRIVDLDFDHVRWVQSTWAGVDSVDWSRLPPDVVVTGLPGLFGAQMAEFVFAYLLGRSQRVPERHRTRTWDTTVPSLLDGSLLGILGAGSIGGGIATVARAFGMTIRGCRRTGRPDERYDEMFGLADVAEFAGGVDHLVAVLPHTRETEGIIDGALLARLGPGATFINVGRGATAITDDVVRSVESGQLGLAVLDVTDPEPLPAEHAAWKTPGIVITGHTAAHSRTDEVAGFFVANLERYMQGERLRGVIDRERGY
ncbi:MAG: NAD(P)-dependent oxidoreductase [Acidimicrobiia bacterium]|nr:NAD(P)-dependent oxidoreductase [Acidimicrobiia bacterium]